MSPFLEEQSLRDCKQGRVPLSDKRYIRHMTRHDMCIWYFGVGVWCLGGRSCIWDWCGVCLEKGKFARLQARASSTDKRSVRRLT